MYLETAQLNQEIVPFFFILTSIGQRPRRKPAYERCDELATTAIKSKDLPIDEIYEKCSSSLRA
jgi:hypothetical protein